LRSKGKRAVSFLYGLRVAILARKRDPYKRGGKLSLKHRSPFISSLTAVLDGAGRREGKHPIEISGRRTVFGRRKKEGP